MLSNRLLAQNPKTPKPQNPLLNFDLFLTVNSIITDSKMSGSKNEETVKVMVRIRPMNASEK